MESVSGCMDARHCSCMCADNAHPDRPAQEGQECRALGRLELEVTFHQFLLMGTA